MARTERARRLFGHPSAPLLGGVVVAAVTGLPWLGGAIAVGGSLWLWSPWRRAPAFDPAELGRDIATATRSEAEARWVLEALTWKIDRARQREAAGAEATLAAILGRAWVLVELERWSDAARDADELIDRIDAVPQDMRPYVLAFLARADGEWGGPERSRAHLERAWPTLSACDRAAVAYDCANACSQRGNRDAALAWIERGFEAVTSEAAVVPGNPYREAIVAEPDTQRADIVSCLVGTALGLHELTGDFAGALAQARRMIPTAEELLSHHASHRFRLACALARAEHNAGRWADAIARLEGLVARGSGDAELGAVVVLAQAALAEVCIEAQRLQIAAEAARAGLAALEAVAEGERDGLGRRLRASLASAELRLGDREAARAVLRDDDAPEVRAELALADGDVAAAEAHAREAVRAASAHVAADHPFVTDPSRVLARVLVAADRRPDAMTILEPAIAIVEAACGPEHPQLIGLLETLADATPDHARATALRMRAEELREATLSG